jgi:hypothetical protein
MKQKKCFIIGNNATNNMVWLANTNLLNVYRLKVFLAYDFTTRQDNRLLVDIQAKPTPE